jgi:hypothetical protein
MEAGVRVQVNRIGDAVEADRCLDALEQASGLRGEPNSRGRLYVLEAGHVFAAHHRIIDHLPKGWQDHLTFDL